MAYAFLDQYYLDGSNAELAKVIEQTLTEIVIPDGVKKIGRSAFFCYYDLKKVTIPEGVEIIQNGAFGWTSITELTLPLSCHTLEESALSSLYVAKKIKLGNVKSIGSRGLAQQDACVEYDFTACDSVPTLASADVFDYDKLNKNNPKMLVPADLYAEWIAATNWAEYASYIVPAEKAPSAVTPDYVSEGLEYVSNTSSYDVIGRGSCLDSVIVIPETFDDGVHGELPVRRITGVENNEEDGAFANDQTIEEIVLPESGVYIDWHAFKGSSLKSVRNYFGGASFWSAGLALEYVSFIDGVGIDNYDFWEVNRALTLDFSRHTAVPEFTDTEYLAIHPDLKILVPLELYDEWIAATNWAEYAEYIVAAR